MHAVDGSLPPRLRRIGCWRIDAELLAYLQAHMQARWPGVQLLPLQARDAPQQTVVDAWLLGESPAGPPSAPAIVLGTLQREDSMESVAERLWRISSPITGRRMLAELEAALRGLNADNP
ncbi:MAG: hypothetical protein KDI48_07880 [Xanthomonadales bacterium]|nr:hypothetical protein [Xanthomonadales bacterium]